ncbi:MAG: hypothetical protein AAFQ45_02160 [Pseudomonadota bacterium]
MLGQVAPALAQSGARAASVPGSPAPDYAACQTQDDQAFASAIRSITRKALDRGLANVNYEAVVRAEWRKLDIDDVIDKRVEIAAAAVRSESSWSSLLKSLAYRKRAKELATAVAERVYRSDAVKTAISGLSTGVGQQIGQAIELSTIDAAGPAETCVKAFLGDRYGTTIAGAVQADARETFRVGTEAGGASVGAKAVLLENAGGLTGAVVLLVRRQLARMARRLGQRVVGAVLGRLVSVVAGGVGIALIAKDIWDLRFGMLPIITDEMKSKETKANVQMELAKSIEAQIDLQSDEIAAATADKIVGIWKSFQRAHAKTLELAEKQPEFRAFVDTLTRRELPRLDEAVALILPKDGEAGVMAYLRDGRLQTAVTRLSDAGMTIARERQSLSDGLKWSAIAGDKLPTVLDLGLHKRTAPDDFSRAALNRVLAVDNRAAALKLAALPPDTREILFELQPDKLTGLGRGLEVGELTSLASYLRGLARPAGQRVLELVADTPARMTALAKPAVRDAIVGSRDQLAAVNMLLRESGPLSPNIIGRDLSNAVDGTIHPRLIWEKHPIVVVGMGLVVLILLLLLRGIFFGGRRKPPAPAGDAI